MDEQERLIYKQEFDREHREYKSLQAELDSINQDLAGLDRELHQHPEGSPQFLVSLAVPVWVLALEVRINSPPFFKGLVYDVWLWLQIELDNKIKTSGQVMTTLIRK